MITLKKSEDFQSEFDIVGILILHEKNFVLLKRASHKPQGGTWGAPGGKVEKNETPLEAIIRETYEETGLILNEQNTILHQTFFVTHDEHCFSYHLYTYQVASRPSITLEENCHDEYKWFSQEDITKIPLIHDMEFCITDFFQKSQ